MGLDIVEYVMTVEELFEVRLPDAELRAVRTPRELARVVRRQLPKSRVRDRWLQLRPSTLGSLAERVVAEHPATLRKSDEGWAESQIAEILLRVVEREQGLEPHRFDIDSEFVHDMGMD